MNDLNCPFCLKEFDLKENKPRILPNCQHRLCSNCIKNIIEKDEESLVCPIDQTKFKYYNKRTGLACFQLDFVLMKNMKAKRNSMVSKKNDIISIDSLKDYKEPTMCFQHKSPLELVCLTNFTSICTDCVLFGEHKNHLYKKKEAFKEDIKAMIIEAEEQYEELEKEIREKEESCSYDKIKKKVLEKKEFLLDEIKSSVEFIIKKAREKEKRMMEEVEELFVKFETAKEVIKTSNNTLKNKKEQINKTIKKTKLNIKEERYYYNNFMKHFCAANNVFNEMKKLKDNYRQLEADSDFLIDKEINRFDFFNELRTVTEAVNGSMGIFVADKISHEPIVEKELTLHRIDSAKPYENEVKLITEDSFVNLEQSDFIERNSVNRPTLNIKDSEFDEIKEREHRNVFIDDKTDQNSTFRKQARNYRDPRKTGTFIDTPRDREENPMNSLYTVESKYNRHYKDDFDTPVNKGSQSFYNQDPIINPFIYHYGSNDERLELLEALEKRSNEFKKKKRKRKEEKRYSNITVKQQKPVRRNTEFFFSMPTDKQSKKKVTAKPIEPEIDLTNKSLTDDQLPELLKDIMKNKSLKILNLSHNNLTTIGFNKLIDTVSNHPSLETLYMTHNYLDDKLFIRLCKNVKKMVKLKRFCFKHCTQLKDQELISKYIKKLKEKGVTVEV